MHAREAAVAADWIAASKAFKNKLPELFLQQSCAEELWHMQATAAAHSAWLAKEATSLAQRRRREQEDRQLPRG